MALAIGTGLAVAAIASTLIGTGIAVKGQMDAADAAKDANKIQQKMQSTRIKNQQIRIAEEARRRRATALNVIQQSGAGEAGSSAVAGADATISGANSSIGFLNEMQSGSELAGEFRQKSVDAETRGAVYGAIFQGIGSAALIGTGVDWDALGMTNQSTSQGAGGGQTTLTGVQGF